MNANHSEPTPTPESSRPQDDLVPYEPPTVESVKLTDEVAESLT